MGWGALMDEIKNNIKDKKCAKCNVGFSCSASGNSCWCNNHQLSEEQLNFLKNNYDNCLCESCIVEFTLKVK
jgi:hypothetical protein